MKKKAIYFFLIIFILLGFNQIFYKDFFEYINPIMILNSGPMKFVDIRNFIPWFINYSLVVFYFFGFFKKNLREYGYIEIIKNNSKIHWLNKRIKRLLISVGIYVVFIQLINLILNLNEIDTLNIRYYILSVILYFLTIVALTQLQGILEILLNEEQAIISIMSITVFSVMLGGVLYKFKKMEKLLYLLIPNNGISYRNNILEPIDFGLNPIISLIFLLILNSIIYFIFIILIKRRDIL